MVTKTSSKYTKVYNQLRFICSKMINKSLGGSTWLGSLSVVSNGIHAGFLKLCFYQPGLSHYSLHHQLIKFLFVLSPVFLVMYLLL